MFRSDADDRGRAHRSGTPGRRLGLPPGNVRSAATGRRTFVTSAALLTTALLLPGGGGATDAHAADEVVLRLPAPTGPHPIGVTPLHLVDHARRDPWYPDSPVRELMVTVFYPAARTGPRYPIAPQMTPGAAELFTTIDVTRSHPQLPDAGVNWAATLTHSHTGAPAQPVRRPVLLYTPGGGDPRTLGTGLAEQLASHGYVVVTLDHAGETTEVEFPGGRMKWTELRDEDPAVDAPLFRKMIDTRIGDVRFVLDRLVALAAGRNPDAQGRGLPEGLERALDVRRVGVYGHSAGGTTAAEAMYEIPRIRAAVNLEGYLDYPATTSGGRGELFPVARNGVDRPLLLLGTDGFHNERFEHSWPAVLSRSCGNTRRRRIDNAGHGVFTDFAAMAPQLQKAGLMTADERRSLIGGLSPEESVPLVRRHVLSFFARHLPSR